MKNYLIRESKLIMPVEQGYTLVLIPDAYSDTAKLITTDRYHTQQFDKMCERNAEYRHVNTQFSDNGIEINTYEFPKNNIRL